MFKTNISTYKTIIAVAVFVYFMKLRIVEMIPTTIIGKTITIPQLALSASIRPRDGPK
jgi:hypothetical protein